MKDIFRFKQFVVNQSGCAMRINTDGVLLAASVNAENITRILDVGTGTGVIALMLAQKFQDALIDAVEIEQMAAQTALQNFENSPFSKRLQLYHQDIADYRPGYQFDLIVSNPPFFTNDQKSPDKAKEIARHANDDFFKNLICQINTLLTENGQFWVILPVNQAEKLMKEASVVRLYPQKLIAIHSDSSKKTFRTLMIFGKQPVEVVKEHFYIYKAEKQYTSAYQMLLKDYFLAF